MESIPPYKRKPTVYLDQNVLDFFTKQGVGEFGQMLIKDYQVVYSDETLKEIRRSKGFEEIFLNVLKDLKANYLKLIVEPPSFAITDNATIRDRDPFVVYKEYCENIGVKVSKCTHWSDGGEGTKDLAKKVVEICDNSNPKNFKFLYDENETLWNKVEKIAKEIYKASKITAEESIKEQLKIFEKNGYGKLPVCIAKTQYSFSIDPKIKGAPSDHEIVIREIRLSSGAEFVVVICGSIMTMPGLPRKPAADSIGLNNRGEVEGLF